MTDDSDHLVSLGLVLAIAWCLPVLMAAFIGVCG